MRPRYGTPGIVLARSSLAEASALVSILTPEFGLVRARAQGVRKPGAKLAPALQTLAESDLIFVRGKDGWRLPGANLGKNWAAELPPEARRRAGRIALLALRLLHGESQDPSPYLIFKGFLEALPRLPEEDADAAETLAALRLLRALGFDAGDMPGQDDEYDETALAEAKAKRRELIARVNRGIAASGL